MAISVVMPALEMAQETGKLVAWLKKEGERVRKGEMLLEVETDKAVVEVEAASDGILAGISANVGDVVPVGRTIAWLVAPGEAPPAADSVAAPTARRSDTLTPTQTAPVAASRVTPSASQRISPKARRLAKEHGVDLSGLNGSGPGGEILAEDVLAATKSNVGADLQVGPVGPRPLTSIGRLMAERTTQSWTTVPHFFVTREIDAGALREAREGLLPAIERSHGVKVTHTDFIVAAVARTLRRHSRLNASWTADGIVEHSNVNVALAVAVENAVVTTVIPKADRTTVGDISVRRRDLS